MKTAVDYIIDQLWAPCRGIPSHIIEEAKRLEKEQIMKAWYNGFDELRPFVDYSEEYYNKTYNQNK